MRRGVALAVFMLLLLTALLPLRLALEWAGAQRALSAARVEGTVWHGRLQDARLRGLSLGDAALSLDLLSLLGGRIGFRFIAYGALAGDGVASPDALRAGSLRFPLRAFSPNLPLDGELQLTGLDIAFRDGACRRAQGSARVVRAQLADGVTLPPDFALRGALGCAGKEAVLRLMGVGDGVEIASVLRLAADGAWRLESRISAQGRAMTRVDRGSLAL